jgi:hypothetical protein
MLTYAEFSGAVLRALGDPDQATYNEELVYDGTLGAHTAVLPWLPNYNEITLTAGSNGALFTLPDDLYDLQAVQIVESGKFMPRATLAANTYRGSSLSENNWIESPKGYLSLSTPIDDGETIVIHYLAYWPVPATSIDTDFAIQVPQVAHLGLTYYAASHCLAPSSVDASMLGQFKTKVDAGTPEHNPLRAQANWFRTLFYQEMKMMPPYQKASA